MTFFGLGERQTQTDETNRRAILRPSEHRAEAYVDEEEQEG